MASISSPGLGSGLDINALVSQLVAAEAQAPTQRLDRRETNLQVRLSAYGTIRGAVAQFQTSLASLQNVSAYRARSASTSDTDVLSASVNSSAVAASYDIAVTQLAERHRLSTDPTTNVNARFTEVTDVLGTGSLTFRFGTTTYDTGSDAYTGFDQNIEKASQTVEITDGSLQGIRDAVNEADIGVTAAIIFDGTYQRLTFSSDDSGEANSLQIITDDADADDTDTSGLSLLAFNDAEDGVGAAGTTNLAQNTAAQNSTGTVNGIAIENESNSISNVIEGVTLNFAEIGTSSLTVGINTDAATTAVNSFISNYNGLISVINDLTAFDPDTGQAGQLNGDGVVRGLEGQIKRILGDPLSGSAGVFNILSDIGITSNSTTGLLEIDDSVLSNALENNIDDVIGLFAAFGRPTDNNISFDSSTDATLEGTYAVSIDSLATKGLLTASAAANLTITAGSNDALTIEVDGITTDITLSAGTYTTSTLVAEVQSQINAAAEITAGGSAVTVSESAGVLTITSNRYGSASQVQITGGNGRTDLVGATTSNTTGLDVTGSIGGVAGTGSGQFLTGTGAATGLKIQVEGVTTGDRGSITFARGFAERFDGYVESLLNDDGILNSTIGSLETRIDSIGDDRVSLGRRLTSVEARLRSQFIALDILVSQLQNTSSFLTQQLSSLPTIGAPRSNN